MALPHPERETVGRKDLVHLFGRARGAFGNCGRAAVLFPANLRRVVGHLTRQRDKVHCLFRLAVAPVLA